MQQRTNHFSNYIAPSEVSFHLLLQLHFNIKDDPFHSTSFLMVNVPRIWQLYKDMKIRRLQLDNAIISVVMRALERDQDLAKMEELIRDITDGLAGEKRQHEASFVVAIDLAKKMQREDLVEQWRRQIRNE